MQSLEITDEQHERFAAIGEEVAAAYAGEYASVQPTDVMAYLLDVAATVDDPTVVPDATAGTAGETTVEDEGKAEETGHTDSDDADGDASGGLDGPGMLNLLEDHDEKWHEADGDARYEVDLPDDGTETARTRDDVKTILFKHYR